MNKQLFAYYNPVRIYSGINIYDKAVGQILGSSTVRVGLFYGQKAMRKMGAIEAIKKILPDCEIQDYGNISPNPNIQDIVTAIDGLGEIDWVIGIGGGSVLDFAKSVAFMACQEENLHTFLTHKKPEPIKPSLPFVAIPTTSGTGSEVTPWATIWNKLEKKKLSLSHREMFPNYAIVDPTLTISVPPYITAYTGYDAISHALEAYWSKYANPVSDLFAIEAIQLIMRHLHPATKDLCNLRHRIQLAMASLYAGMAFSNTQTTIVHAISYPMTLHYLVPHGVACSLTLAKLWRYNLSAIDETKVLRLLNAVGEKNPEAFAQRLEALTYQTGLPTTLAQAGIPREGIDIILDESENPKQVANNPRQLSRGDLRKMLERIYD